MSIKIKTQSQLEKYITKKSKLFEDIKNKQYVEDTLASFKDDNLPNPFDVVREYIMEKGLKLYGGQALHEHMQRKGKPIYDKYEFPDYDVFSPDAWNHAKELSDRLFKLGFFFVETKASIVNDEKHQTYKVSVDLIAVLDLTQVGCSASKLEIGDCENCGMDIDKKCFSLFNNIPAVDILSNNEDEFTESYNYNKQISLYPDKLLVCSPDWLKISMYLEMSQPFNDPTRLEKVYNRLSLFEGEFDYNKCNLDDNNFTLDKKTSDFYNSVLMKKLLSKVENYIKSKKLLHYGSSAYNFFVNGHNYPKEPVINYEVYTDEDPDAFYNELVEILESDYKKSEIIFKIVPRIMYWKDIDADNYDIMFKLKNTNYKQLITFTKSYECMPYIQYNGIRYASFDRIKYNYYRGAALPEIILKSQFNPRHYKCLLKNLLDLEAILKKKKR